MLAAVFVVVKGGVVMEEVVAEVPDAADGGPANASPLIGGIPSENNGKPANAARCGLLGPSSGEEVTAEGVESAGCQRLELLRWNGRRKKAEEE